jgi:hypothetical protein
MKMKKMKWLFITMSAVVIVILFIIFYTPQPPTELISEARLNLTKSEKLKASKYSKELYDKAKMSYDFAMKKWKSENEKIFFMRDFSTVEVYAEQSNSYSLMAIKQSIENATLLENEIRLRISNLIQQIDFIKLQFGNFPYNEINANQIAKCNLTLKEIVIDFKQYKLHAAEIKLDSAELIVIKLISNYELLLTNYFKSYNEWKNLVQKTITTSAKKSTYSIIIDKYNRECLVYFKGELKEKYPVELGSNWIGDKNQQGDKSTPEGMYKVIEKKENGSTKYYKALLLNYPNEEDKRNFKINKEKGIISKNAKIGNLIEIHGNGGKDIDWTDGCVALTNSDMDKLFNACKLETIVTIVGSVKPLDEIYNSQK